MKNWSKVRPVIQIHCPLFSFMLTERKKKKKSPQDVFLLDPHFIPLSFTTANPGVQSPPPSCLKLLPLFPPLCEACKNKP